MQTTIYIRKDNEEAWAAIKDKSEYVNAMLTAREILNDNSGAIAKIVRENPKPDANIGHAESTVVEPPRKFSLKEFQVREAAKSVGKVCKPGKGNPMICIHGNNLTSCRRA